MLEKLILLAYFTLNASSQTKDRLTEKKSKQHISRARSVRIMQKVSETLSPTTTRQYGASYPSQWIIQIVLMLLSSFSKCYGLVPCKWKLCDARLSKRSLLYFPRKINMLCVIILKEAKKSNTAPRRFNQRSKPQASVFNHPLWPEITPTPAILRQGTRMQNERISLPSSSLAFCLLSLF